MDVELEPSRTPVAFTAQASVILLDTNALIWLLQNHRRSRGLVRLPTRLYLSPATLLELQLLVEVGSLHLKAGATVMSVLAEDRWALDEPPAGAWFAETVELGWTRDPFDRLIVAHAQLRGWRLATGDSDLIARLGPTRTLAV